MFEKEIKFISAFSLNKIKNLGSYITFEKLSSINLHPAILTYISAELEYMIYADRKKLLNDSLFDYSGKEISENFKKIVDEIKKTKKISFEDIKKLITQAVSFNVNFITRPKWSLSKLVYNNKDTVSVDELELNLNYLYYYDYIKNVLSAYIAKRQVVHFSVTELDLILNKIDRELYKLNSEELINTALISMGDFFNIGGIDKTIIPLSAVEILLKEKNLIDYLLKLHRAIPNDTKKKYNIDDIKNILYSRTPAAGVDVEDVETLEESPTVEISEQGGITIETEEALSGIESNSEVSDDDSNESKSVNEDVTEPEEILPIEEEFENDLDSSKVKLSGQEDQRMYTGQAKELIDDDDEMNSIIESEINDALEDEISSEREVSDYDERDTEEIKQANEVNSAEADELLAFYEKELEKLDDRLSDRNVNEENSSETNDDSGIQITEETEFVDESNEVKNDNVTPDTDSFKPSIFQEAEKNDINDYFREQQKKESNGVESDRDVRKKFDQEKPETIAQEEIEQELTVEKEIVNEMIDDHEKNEGDEFNQDDPEQEYFDIIDEESTSEQTYGFTKEFGNEDEIVWSFDKTDSPEANSNINKEFTDDDDISKVIDEFDEALNGDSTLKSNLKKEGKQDKSNGKNGSHPPKSAKISTKEEFQFEEHMMIEDDENSMVRVEIPVREKDLLSYLTKKDIKKIITNVFAGDDEDFVTSIEKISECGSYNEATEILKVTFFSYRISPYSKEAVLLTNATSNYFRQV
jgi:hypothetical protein